jgi:hypothetical protein
MKTAAKPAGAGAHSRPAARDHWMFIVVLGALGAALLALGGCKSTHSNAFTDSGTFSAVSQSDARTDGLRDGLKKDVAASKKDAARQQNDAEETGSEDAGIEEDGIPRVPDGGIACGSVPYEGCCQGTLLKTCDENDQLQTEDCTDNPACGWDTDYYSCGTAGGADPSSSSPKDCP